MKPGKMILETRIAALEEALAEYAHSFGLTDKARHLLMPQSADVQANRERSELEVPTDVHLRSNLGQSSVIGD